MFGHNAAAPHLLSHVQLGLRLDQGAGGEAHAAGQAHNVVSVVTSYRLENRAFVVQE